jgi:hypothetical protein
MGLVSLLKNNVSEGKFNLLIECLLSGNRYRSLAPSFLVNHLTELHHLESLLTERIENFEAQSGDEKGPSVLSCRVQITNISSAPNPEARPFSSDSANIQWSKDIKAERKASRRPSPTMSSITNMQSTLSSQIDSLNSTMTNGLKEVVQAIKAPSSTPSILGSINWAPLIQGIANVVVTSLGGTANFPTSQAQTPAEAPVVSSNLAPIVERLNSLETKMETRITTLESSILALTQSQAELARTTNAQM